MLMRMMISLVNEAFEVRCGMQLDERIEGDYRIVAWALHEPRRRGYVAAVIVQRRGSGQGGPREAYHDEDLAGGYVWPSAQAARLYAVAKAQEIIRHEAFRLAC
jgi:hypothetical protein